jgi:hypothetical protein
MYEIKQHYSQLFDRFFNNEEITGLLSDDIPSIHIPIVGKHYGKEKYWNIAAYGQETPSDAWKKKDKILVGNEKDRKYFKQMSELKKIYYDQGFEKAYGYLGNTFQSLKYLNLIPPNGGGFFDFIVKFLSELYEKDVEELKDITKEENKEILLSYIWANINVFEGNAKGVEETAIKYKVDAKKWKKILEVANEVFNKEYELSFIVETFKPNILLIMDGTTFKCKEWINKYTLDYEMDDWNKNYFYYAHIKTGEIDTHVFKTDHPTNINIRNVTYKDVIKKIICYFKDQK